MTVTMKEPVPISTNAVRFVWSSDLSDPVFNVYRNGKLVRTTRSNHYTHRGPAADVIDVRDDAANPANAAEGDVDFIWPAISGAVQYKVEREVSPGVWDLAGLVPETGAPAYTFPGVTIPSGQDVSFRVKAIDANDNESVAATRTVHLKKHPDPPEVVYAYNDQTNKVTISAA